MPLKDLSTAAACVLTWIVMAIGFGTASGLGQRDVGSGVVTGVLFATMGAVVVGVALRRIGRFEPVRASQLRSAVPLAVVVGTLAGAPLMGVLYWAALRT